MKKSKLTLDKLNVVRLNNTFQVFGGEVELDDRTNPVNRVNQQQGSSQPCLDARAQHDARMNGTSSEPCKTIRRTGPSTRRCAHSG